MTMLHFYYIVQYKWFYNLKNRPTILSLLDISGFTSLNNTTNKNGPLYISGLNVLDNT